MPARGIVRSSFFFVPLIKKSKSLLKYIHNLFQIVEQEEETGISFVLEKDKELDAVTLKTLKQLKLFETKSRYYESLVKNYQNGQRRAISREGHPELLTLHKQSMALNKIYGKNQVIKGVVARKQYTNKSPLLREDQARTMGNSFYAAAENSEINISLKDHNHSTNTYVPAKTIPESPQNLIGRIQTRIESSHIENRTPLRKSEERGATHHGAFDVSRRVVTDEGTYREDRIKLINDQSLNRSALRPSSPGVILLTSNENMKKPRNSKTEPRHQNNFIIHQNGNQKHFILENLALLKEDMNRAQKKVVPPVSEVAQQQQSREGNPRRWIRHPPDAKIKILHRRATGVGNKENSGISEVVKTEGAASTGNASPQHFTVESSWYPIATEGAQENELRAKKYSIPERGPIRAVASIRSRVKKDSRQFGSEVEGGGRSHVIHTDLEISDLANSDIKWANSSLEGIEPLKLRSKSIGKKPTNKTAVIIRKGRKIQEPDPKQLIFS